MVQLKYGLIAAVNHAPRSYLLKSIRLKMKQHYEVWFLFREGQHHHQNIASKNIISEETHQRIVELCLLGHKPERIPQQLKSDGLDKPDKIYLNNLLKKNSKRKIRTKNGNFF